ncbi:MAG: redoxin domain-containing protein [Methylococcaceae bacterium]|nr:redoxin domain-containing protein [Methylococcaceae bacterium]
MQPSCLSRCGVFVFLLTAGFAAAVPEMEPRPLPDYRARLLGSDREVDIAGLRGQAILINTWATWCPPCREEMPDFETIHQRYRDQGLAVVGVNIDEGQADEAVANYVQGMGLSFAIWRDPQNRFSKRFRSLGVPETFLANQSGMIIRHWQGPMDPNAPGNLEVIQTALGIAVLPGAAQKTAATEASPKRGKRLAEQRGCLTCHSTDGSPGAGPTWKGLTGSEVLLADGRRITRDRAYLARAIVEPDREIVAGYAPGVMAGAMPGKPLSATEVEALVLFLESISK